MAKTTSDSILGVIRKESWILDYDVVSKQYAWQRSALSECFSSSFSFSVSSESHIPVLPFKGLVCLHDPANVKQTSSKCI